MLLENHRTASCLEKAGRTYAYLSILQPVLLPYYVSVQIVRLGVLRSPRPCHYLLRQIRIDFGRWRGVMGIQHPRPLMELLQTSPASVRASPLSGSPLSSNLRRRGAAALLDERAGSLSLYS